MLRKPRESVHRWLIGPTLRLRTFALPPRRRAARRRDRAVRMFDQSGFAVAGAGQGTGCRRRRLKPVSARPRATPQGEALARARKTEEALAEFDQAIRLDPNNSKALFGRGLLYQGEQQHQLAIDDFTAANGLSRNSPNRCSRARSVISRSNKAKEAAVDLDEAVQADPQNEQIWTNRGLAYERLGDRTKAAGCYGRAISIRPER